MKKNFSLESTTKKPQQQVDSVRHEIKKYFARERRKKLPDGFDVWLFDCKFGNTAEDAVVIKESEIKESIRQIVSEEKKSFYLEVIAKPGNKPAAPKKS